VSISVVIASRGAAMGPLAGLLGVLAGQGAGEVIASLDVPRAPADVRRAADEAGAALLTGPSVGPAGARNRGLARASGEVVLFLNDDVVPRPGLVAAHARAHERAREAGVGSALVVGAAPFACYEDQTMLDEVVGQTPLVFFYSEMDDADPMRDWGFRHAWTLNLSVPQAVCQPFDGRFECPMFDDLEWGYRVTREEGAPVLHEPSAVAVHHHRYTASDLLKREVLIGHQLDLLRRVSPACASAAFGDRYDARRHEPPTPTPEAALSWSAFARLADVPAGACDPRRAFEAMRPWREAARWAGAAAAAAGRPWAEGVELASAALGVADGR